MTISKLHLHVTNRCTSYCRHCSSGSGPNAQRTLTNSDFQYILDWAYDAGAQWVEFSGGEPLTLGEDLFEILQYAHQKSLYTSILTNGSLLDEKTAQKFRAVGAARVGISVYGATARTHNDFTQTPYAFSQTLNGIRNAIQTGIETVVNVIVTPQNLNELHHLPSLLDDIDLYTFGSIVPAGRGASAPDYSFSETDYEHAITKIQRDFTGINHYFMISLYPYSSHELERFCMRPIDEVTINPKGCIIPCCVLPITLRNRLGKIRNRDLAESYAQLSDDPVFYWLQQGHRSMRQVLQYPSVSMNLCASCIDMCNLITSGRYKRNEASQPIERGRLNV
jgi:MoaA/NifB/PqqE/SkfB family radical SAM enzyme